MYTGEVAENLTAILLNDFDDRRIPSGVTRRVAYTNKPDVDCCNRYTGVHPYLVVTSFLDPWTRDLLGGDNDNTEYILAPTQFDSLKEDGVERMMVKIHKDTVNGEGIYGTKDISDDGTTDANKMQDLNGMV